MDSKTLKEIREVIRKALDEGGSQAELMEFMKKSGYGDAEIDEAFRDIVPEEVEDLRKALSGLERPSEEGSKTDVEEEAKKLELLKAKKVCPKCGHINSPDAKFCGGCGVKL